MLGAGRGEVVATTGVPQLVHSETLSDSITAAASPYLDAMPKGPKEMLAVPLHPRCALLPEFAEKNVAVPTVAPNLS